MLIFRRRFIGLSAGDGRGRVRREGIALPTLPHLQVLGPLVGVKAAVEAQLAWVHVPLYLLNRR